MARLFEFQGKSFLRENGILIPAGEVASTAEEARNIVSRMGKPVVIKAQIWAGGRGKSGAVKIANSPEEAENVARNILGMIVKGFPVRKVLVEEKLVIQNEFYVGVIPDSSRYIRGPVVIFSKEGGMNIEDVAADKIFRKQVDYVTGFPVYDAIDMAKNAGMSGELLSKIANTDTGR
jgi:succinyl-CoA synthetase beta subunit